MIYFTSDQHFGHNNVIKYCNRPFESVYLMNEHMVEKWNEVVQPEDTVYHLGDFSMSAEQMRLYLPRLNGTKILIAGNHDKVHPACFRKNKDKQAKFMEMYLTAGFSQILLETELKIGGVTAKLCHLPYTADHDDNQRHKEYRPINKGQWLICGHIHCGFKISEKQINVGVDVWDFKPVSLLEIISIIEGYKAT